MNAVHDMKRNVLLRIKPLTRRNAAQGINNGSSPISPFSLRLPLPLLNPPTLPPNKKYKVQLHKPLFFFSENILNL